MEYFNFLKNIYKINWNTFSEFLKYVSHIFDPFYSSSLLGPILLNGIRKNNFYPCNGIHPFPMMFESSLLLIPEVKYLLSLHMSFQINGELSDFPVATIWGFQGVPRIKTPGQDTDLLRWKQVYRKGLSSSVSSGQFPMLYYIQ